MLCEKCGKPFQGEGTLCSECATAMANAQQQTQAPEEAVNQTVPQQVQQEDPQAVQPQENQQENPQVQQQEDPQAAQNPEAPAEEVPLVLSTPDAPAKKAKKVNGKLIGIIAAVLALVGGACFFFFFTDTGKYMTSSPEKYLQDVQQEQIDTYIDGASAVYGAMLEGYAEPVATKGEMRLQVGDHAFELAESLGGVPASELQFLKDIRLGFDTNVVNSTTQTGLRFALGETEILQSTMLVDMMTARMYMAFPGLNNDYMSALIPDSGGFNPAQYQTALDKLREDLPTQRQMHAFLTMLSETALAEIVNVQGAEEIVSINGFTEKQHVLTATITQGDILRMVKSMLEKAQSDETFQQLVKAISTFGNIMGSDVDIYTEVMKQLPITIAELTAQINTATSGDTILLKTYVNHSGEITGRIVTIFAGGPAEEVLRMLSVTEDGVTYIQGNVQDFHVVGQSSTSGKVTTTKYTYYAGATEMCKMDVVATEDQSTELIVTPSSGMIDALLGEFGGSQLQESAGPLAGILSGSISFRVTFGHPDSELPAVSVSAQLGDKNLFTLSLTVQEADAQSITLPQTYAAAENEAEAQKWLEKIDINVIVDRLRAAGVPESILSQLTGAVPSQPAQAVA